MKRFCYLVVLMMVSPSAYAGESLSFVVGGHRIHIEAPRNCRSASCVSVSIPGIYSRSRDRDEDVDAAPDTAPAKPLAAAPAPVAAPPVAPPAIRPAVQAVASAPPAATVGLAAATTHEVAAPSPPAIQQCKTSPATPATTPPAAALIERPTIAARPAPVATPQVSGVSHEVDDGPELTPLGDWQTEGRKGSVRIAQCGRALCGYILNVSSNAVGETVLINMKPNATSQWSGNIVSRDSGNTYYATMTMKGANSLRVEACAFGKFYCSGNVWSRIDAPPEKLITSTQEFSPPRS
jgi:Uncharacterized protein conserved in bacteria (DUF2147)